jgi:hypothetical protein
MDTARIDTQRLQLLNACILQTIDALNQVRMSVHSVAPWGVSPWTAGLGHTTPDTYANA